MRLPTCFLAPLVIAGVVGCSQTASGDEATQPAIALLVLRFIDGPNLETDGHPRSLVDVDPFGIAGILANKDSTLVKCFCRLWDHTARGASPIEAAAAILYHQKSDDFYCAPAPLGHERNRRTFGIPEGTVGTVHTHPNNRGQVPSEPEDYGACRARPGFILTSEGIWGIPPGCQDEHCAHKLTDRNWYRHVCQLVEKRAVSAR